METGAGGKTRMMNRGGWVNSKVVRIGKGTNSRVVRIGKGTHSKGVVKGTHSKEDKTGVVNNKGATPLEEIEELSASRQRTGDTEKQGSGSRCVGWIWMCRSDPGF